MTYDTIETRVSGHTKYYGVARDNDGREVYRTPEPFLSRAAALAKLCEWDRLRGATNDIR